MFALRAFLGLCAIGYIEVEGNNYLVDLNPGPRKGKRKKPIVESDDYGEVQLIRFPQIGHREWWMIYQRILRSSQNFSWAFPIDSRLDRCNVRSLSRDRNLLHYQLRWFYNDLMSPEVKPSFGSYSQQSANDVVNVLENCEGSDGLIVLNQVILGNCINLLTDIADSSRRVGDLLSLIKAAIERFENDIVTSWYSLIAQSS